MWLLKRSKKQPLTGFQQGNRFLVSGHYEKAIECFLAHALSEPSEAAKCYVKAGEAARRSNALDAPADVAPGVKLVAMGNLARAEAFFRDALTCNPTYFPALAGLASVLPNQHPERLDLLQRAAAVRDDLSVLNALGEHFLQIEPRRAIQYFDRATSHNPLDKTAYDGLIAAHMALGQENEAETWRQRWCEAYARKPRVDGRHDA